MEKTDKYSWCPNALEFLKQKTILNNLASIDLDNKIDLYDKLMAEFAAGNLDSVFVSPALDGLSTEESKELLKQARKYIALIFSRGDIQRWLESVEGVTLGDYELVCMKILNNFNFLLQQLRSDRKHALDRLMNFREFGFGDESSVIERLRCGFYSSEALDKVLEELANNDGEYSRFSDEHMSILCTMPEGTLYTFDENKKPVLYNFIDIQQLIVFKMEELEIDELTENYFKKAASEVFMDYSGDMYEIMLSNTAGRSL